MRALWGIVRARWAVVGIGVLAALLLVGAATQRWLSRNTISLSALEESYLGQVTKWPPQLMPIASNVTAELETRWREGFLQYRVRVTPEPRLKQGGTIEAILLLFYDVENFELARVERPVSELMVTVDDRGKRTDLLMEGKVALSRDNYSRITKWAMAWRQQ